MTHNTRNIKFCAFLRMKNIHPFKVEKFSTGRAIYKYEMDQDEWDDLQIVFNESEFIEYANCLDAIKNLAY